jgi:hypothetical protein
MPRAFKSPALDRMAITLSGLCVLHCVLSVIVIAAMAGTATFLTDPAIHKIGLIGAILLAVAALGQGYATHRSAFPVVIGGVGLVCMIAGLFVPHGWPEIGATVTGVTVLAIAHLLNRRVQA